MNGHKDVVALLLDRMDPDLIAAKTRWKDGVTFGGRERAQGRGRAAVGQDVLRKDERGGGEFGGTQRTWSSEPTRYMMI